MRIFLITGASIGVAGTLAGFVLGLLVAENIETIRAGLNKLLHMNLFPPEIYFLSGLPVDRRSGRRRQRGGDDADPVDPRDALSVVARGAARSGRGVALRMTQSVPSTQSSGALSESIKGSRTQVPHGTEVRRTVSNHEGSLEIAVWSLLVRDAGSSP